MVVFLLLEFYLLPKFIFRYSYKRFMYILACPPPSFFEKFELPRALSYRSYPSWFPAICPLIYATFKVATLSTSSRPSKCSTFTRISSSNNKNSLLPLEVFMFLRVADTTVGKIFLIWGSYSMKIALDAMWTASLSKLRASEGLNVKAGTCPYSWEWFPWLRGEGKWKHLLVWCWGLIRCIQVLFCCFWGIKNCRESKE